MTDPVPVLAAVYGVGVVWGLIAADAPLLKRIALALLWPLGPLAFVLTLLLLLLVAPYALIRFPSSAGAGTAGR